LNDRTEVSLNHHRTFIAITVPLLSIFQQHISFNTRLVSKQIGKTVRYNAITDDDFIQMMVEAGAPEDYSRFLASIWREKDGQV